MGRCFLCVLLCFGYDSVFAWVVLFVLLNRYGVCAVWFGCCVIMLWTIWGLFKCFNCVMLLMMWLCNMWFGLWPALGLVVLFNRFAAVWSYIWLIDFVLLAQNWFGWCCWFCLGVFLLGVPDVCLWCFFCCVFCCLNAGCFGVKKIKLFCLKLKIVFWI